MLLENLNFLVFKIEIIKYCTTIIINNYDIVILNNFVTHKDAGIILF